MIEKKTGVWLAASAGAVLVVAAAVAVATTDWRSGGDGQSAPTARTANTDGSTTRRTSYRGSSNRFLIKFDADRDGRITRAEVDAGIVAEFQSIDTNHDGRLDAAEYRAFDDQLRSARKSWREAHPDAESAQDAERPRTYDAMKRLDWNLDGYISMDEWAGRTRAAAMRADGDGDGTILVSDLTRPPARRTASAR